MQKLTLTSYSKSNDNIVAEYSCNFTVQCAGNSIWGNTANKRVRVTGIDIINNIFDNEVYTQVYVKHNAEWQIYTDTGFAAAISEAVGFDVGFTEQGMQDDGLASMEA